MVLRLVDFERGQPIARQLEQAREPQAHSHAQRRALAHGPQPCVRGQIEVARVGPVQQHRRSHEAIGREQTRGQQMIHRRSPARRRVAHRSRSRPCDRPARRHRGSRPRMDRSRPSARDQSGSTATTPHLDLQSERHTNPPAPRGHARPSCWQPTTRPPPSARAPSLRSRDPPTSATPRSHPAAAARARTHPPTTAPPALPPAHPPHRSRQTSRRHPGPCATN